MRYREGERKRCACSSYNSYMLPDYAMPSEGYRKC